MTTMVPRREGKAIPDRHGRWRCYHRKSGKPSKAEFGTAEFFLELKSIEEGQKARDPWRDSRARDRAYRKSPAFKDKATATRAGYLRYIDVASRSTDGARGHRRAVPCPGSRTKSPPNAGAGPQTTHLPCFRSCSSSLRNAGWAKDNPGKGVKRVKRERDRPSANRPWVLEERQMRTGRSAMAAQGADCPGNVHGAPEDDMIGLARVDYKGGSIGHRRTARRYLCRFTPDLG